MSIEISDERVEDVLIFVVGTLDGLIDKGLVDGQKLLTEEGKEYYCSLVESGFVISDEERDIAMNTIMSRG
jgi:hypothetical protein